MIGPQRIGVGGDTGPLDPPRYLDNVAERPTRD